jgi:hypothetical protein
MIGNPFASRDATTLGPQSVRRDKPVGADTQTERVAEAEKLVFAAPILALSTLALAACGGGGDSPTATPTTPPVPSTPSTPRGLTATAGNAQVALAWEQSTGATGYSIGRATSSGGPYASVGKSTSPSFTDTSVANGTAYYYVVSASNATGSSANSAAVSATPTAPIVTSMTLSRTQAARFLAQAAFGGSDTDIQNLQNQMNGIEGWLTQQFAMPINPSGQLSNVAWMQANNLISIEFDTTGVQSSFWRKLIGSPDVLRQRMMLALTDLFVLSRSSRGQRVW